jgi:hypothetical protein
VCHGDPRDQKLDARRFSPAKFRVLQIYVMNDLGNRLQRSIQLLYQSSVIIISTISEK